MNIVSANTGINAQIPYSGTIIKNDGTVLDGTYRAKFIIYPNASPTVGETALYEEIRNGVQTYASIVSPLLSINDGKFDILLGSQNTTGISALNDDTLWLELQLDMDNNGTYEEIFSPRKRIGSALSAINSMKLVANGGVSTNTLSLDSLGNLVFIGDSTTERMRITGGGAITALALGGVANTTTPAGYDRVLLANSLGQFSQVNISTLSSGGSGWGLAGNNTTDAWNGSSGTRLGTTSAQPLVLATTNATAQDIRFFTGSNGANERMRILGNGNIGIGTTTPQARLDVAGGVRIGDDTSACTSSNVGTLRYSNSALQVCTVVGWSDLISNPDNPDGSSASLAAPSAAYLVAQGITTDGVYWIDLPTVGPTQVYCILNPAYDGGGWMMAMKATTGTTFNYNANYWTTVNTLNPTDTTRNNADAKFNTMNYFEAKDIMAIWPDISPNGTESGSIDNMSTWTWLENNFNRGNRVVPITFWNTVDRYFIRDAKTFNGWASGRFSSQVDVRFYGFNYRNNNGNARVRWGFGWNENGGGLYPNGDMNSDDVSGGIGMSYYGVNYSAGDWKGCCSDTTGINRSARVEVYIR
ncbi:MAG: hypothetical protein ACO3UU_03630 [Minisyncoccia bacterium]